MGDRKARTFNLEEMLGQTIKNAQERSKDILKKREEEEIEERNLAETMFKKPKAKSRKRTTNSNTPNEISISTGDIEEVGPTLPPGFTPNIQNLPEGEIKIEEESDSETDSDDSDDSNSDEDETSMILPISSEITLQHGKKPVGAMALDPSGARLLTGGNDYMLKFWDFPGMTQTLEPFRYLEPQEGHHIRDLSYSVTGDNILVVTGSCQPLLYDRDGFLVATSVKGDNYLMDSTKTPGHQAMVNAGVFHPYERGWYVTAANDGTIRQWDVEERKKDMFGCIVIEHHDVRRVKNKQGKRAQPTAIAYDRHGRLVACGANDGQVQVWDIARTVQPKIKIHNAHKAGLEITNISFSFDNNILSSRGADGYLRLWDMRNTKKVLVERDNLPVMFHCTQSCWSPNDKLILTGTSRINKSDGPGRLLFMHRDTLETAKEIDIGTRSVVSVMWHHRLNQIVYTTSDGQVRVLFDEERSHRGAKLCIAKKKRAQDLTEMNVNLNVVVPFQPKNFRDTNKSSSKEAQFLKQRKDPKLSHAPETPISPLVTGQLGRLNAPNGTLHKYIAKEIAMNTADDDPSLIRQKILRHAYRAEEEGNLINKAYMKTQPVNVMAEHKTLQDEDNEFNQPLWKRMKYTTDKKAGKVIEDPDKLV